MGPPNPFPWQVVSQFIFFVTDDDVLDPRLREGIASPSRQLLLSEQLVLDLVIRSVQAPFRSCFSTDDLDTPLKRATPPGSDLFEMGYLAMRLARHIIRGCQPNKTRALSFVVSLQGMLGYSMRVADILTETFTDNEQVWGTAQTFR